MPISISGSGTITGISAGGLPDGCVTGDDIANSTVTATKLGTTEQSQLCRAWVNFNGTGTVAIRASYNVSSITDNGTGDYTINFTTAMPDANYSIAGCCSALNDATIRGVQENTGTTRTASLVRIETANYVSVEDNTYVSVAIFR